MLTFPGGAAMGAVPPMAGAYGTAAPGGPFGNSPAPNVYGAPVYPGGGSYAM